MTIESVATTREVYETEDFELDVMWDREDSLDSSVYLQTKGTMTYQAALDLAHLILEVLTDGEQG